MNQLQVYSPVFGPEGYSEVARGLITALHVRGWNIKLDPFQGWGPWSVQLRAQMASILQRCQSTTLYPQKAPIPHLQICLPEQVRRTENRYIVNLTMFEADRICNDWVEHIRTIDRVVVPNPFCKMVFQRSGVPAQKLFEVPLGFDPEVFNPEVEPLPLECDGRRLSDFPVRILSILEVTNRKNFAGLLLAFFNIAAVVGIDKCCLLLKASNYSVYMSLSRRIEAYYSKFVSEGKIRPGSYNVFNYPPIVSPKQMGQFVKVATHYLSLSLAEGWDLNCMNAKACGVSVIVPDHSGYTGYCTRQDTCLLPIARKQDAEQQGATGRLYAGASWFAVDLTEAILIASDYIRDSEDAQARALIASKMAHEYYTWERCATQLERVLVIK